MSVHRRSSGRALLALITLIASLVMLAAPGGTATLNSGVIGGFQQDGNEIATDGGAGTIDWATALADDTVKVVTDDSADSGFTQGSKELDPADWECGTGGADPGKANILKAFVNPRVDADDIFLDLAFIRELGDEAGGKGDVHVNFEFNQADVGEPGPFSPGPCGIDRRPGDLLITYDFPGGSDAPSIEVYRWAAAGGGNWVNNIIAEEKVAGAVNDEAIDDPVGGYGTLGRQRFGEASLDLEDILASEAGDPECVSFGSVNVRSRSSGESLTSSLQDKLPSSPVDFSTCGSIDLIKKSGSGDLLAGAEFQLWLSDDDTFGDDTAVGDVCTTDAQGVCDWDDLNPGTYFVEETAPPAGYSAPEDPVVGPIDLAFRETVSLADIVNFKRDWDISIAPDDKTNLVGTDHEFTVTVRYDAGDGAGLQPLAEATPAIAIAGVGTVKDTDCDEGTDSAGTCTVTITSPNAGNSTVTATWEAVHASSGASENLSASAVKHWVDYRIDVQEDAVNLVGDDHVFTVTVAKDTGDGFAPLAGADVSLSWSGGAGSSLTSAVPAGATSNGCATDDAGQCKVTVNSSTPLTGTLTATYSTVLDSGSHSFSADGQKRWVNWTLSITPAQAENLVDTNHTFVVKVSRDGGTGGGILPLAGATPVITLAGKGSITANTCSDGTSAAGLCTVTITSSEPGTSTVTAAFSATEDQASISLSASGQKLWVDYRITVSPKTAVNPVDTTHTFTVTLEKNIGDGWVVAGSEKLDLGLTGVGSMIGVDAGVIGSALAGTCTTDAAGTCRVTITSPVGGLATLQASYGATVGETSRTFTDDGAKTWEIIPVVVLAAEELPRTGSPFLPLLLMAGSSLALAGQAVNAGRRRLLRRV